jgi:hypothetical protein
MNYLQARHLPEEEQLRNQAIEQAYFKIIETTIKLASTFDAAMQKQILIDHKSNPAATYQVHEFLSPFIYILLEADEDGNLMIPFAENPRTFELLGKPGFEQLLKTLYQVTYNSNGLNIQDCLEPFEYVPERFETAYSVHQNLIT